MGLIGQDQIGWVSGPMERAPGVGLHRVGRLVGLHGRYVGQAGHSERQRGHVAQGRIVRIEWRYMSAVVVGGSVRFGWSK